MSHRVQLIRLGIQDVGILDGRLDLGPFERGLNVISGRSPLARTAVVAALRAALFERHDDRHAGIMALQANGTRNAPEVRLELSVGEDRMSVHKRFLDKPLVEVRLDHEGAVFTGANAEEMLSGILGSRAADRAGSERHHEDLRAAALDLTARRRALSAQLAAIEGELPPLERERKRAASAEALARDVAAFAEDSEQELANAEARFESVHREIAALRTMTPDALLDERRAHALAALTSAHRRARSAAVTLDAATPELLRGETLRAQGAITAHARRSREIRDSMLALSSAWPLPLVLEDPVEWVDDGRMLSTLQSLREASSELQVILLTGNPLRFSRAPVDCAVDLDRARDERRRAPELGRISR